ncbi:MAG: ParB N-terminal domain-containing protein [Bacteriovoracaceae bacterium]|nr:ParB N-terminal domain-containing protein [Bacteriovoracaceae bacterium]
MQKVALSEIIVTNPYLRTETDIDSLVKSIETVGLINPITINDKNELLAGGRRYQAMKELGWDEAPVQMVERNPLEQELISIDENLVRKPLDKMELEQCLNRGREIYEELNPLANKIEVAVKLLTPEEKKAEKEEEENDTTSFAAITSEKTGLSKSVIKSAIKRDALSSEKIKEARGLGDISASQANEIIKLDKEQQDKILPYVQNRTVKDVRKIVETAKLDGLDQAIEDSMEMTPTPREFVLLKTTTKKMNKLISQIILEDIQFEGKDLNIIIKDMKKLMTEGQDFLNRYDEDSFVPHSQDTDDGYEESSFQ